MSYRVYTTDAFVCGAHARATSDRVYQLFTREAGMLYAHAKSARLERSKHRYGLQEFGEVRVGLIHGKGGWRITGSIPIMNHYFTATTREERGVQRDILALLSRYLHGEEVCPTIYDDAREALSLAKTDGEDARLVFTVRLLSTLGYIASTPEYVRTITDPTLAKAISHLTDAERTHIHHAITHAESVSHL